jgi:hypothetical protein
VNDTSHRFLNGRCISSSDDDRSIQATDVDGAALGVHDFKAVQEERHPAIPIAVGADGRQAAAGLGAVRFRYALRKMSDAHSAPQCSISTAISSRPMRPLPPSTKSNDG